MKRVKMIVALALIFVLLPAASNCEASLIDLGGFVYTFNYLGAFFDNGYTLTLDNVQSFEKVGDVYLYKVIFNECEILSLILTEDVTQIKSISCTWKYIMSGAGDYLEDYVALLAAVFVSCGIKSDSVSKLFEEFGDVGSLKPGDSGEMLLDNIKVSFNVDRSGVSYKLEFEYD